MKRTLLILSAAAIFFASCNTPQNNEAAKGSIPMVDTTGLAEFQMIKSQQMSKPVATRVIQKVYYVPVQRAASPRLRTYRNSQTSMVSESSNTAKVVKKKGWSAAAKGTAIGAGGGAIIGAIINKRNPLVGGVIGGIIGGAAGYGFGHSKDKSNGRY